MAKFRRKSKIPRIESTGLVSARKLANWMKWPSNMSAMICFTKSKKTKGCHMPTVSKTPSLPLHFRQRPRIKHNHKKEIHLLLLSSQIWRILKQAIRHMHRKILDFSPLYSKNINSLKLNTFCSRRWTWRRTVITVWGSCIKGLSPCKIWSDRSRWSWGSHQLRADRVK